MKSFTAPIAFLAAAQYVAGSALLPRSSNSTGVAPAEAGGDFQTESLTVQVDCNQLLNQVLAGVSAYPQFTSQVVAVGKKAGLPAGTAYSVCKAIKTEAVDCAYLAGSVAGAISMAITAGYIDLDNEGAEGATKRGSSAASLEEKLKARMRRQGAQFDSISVLTSRSDESQAGVEHRAQILGARLPGLSSTAADFAIQRLPRGNAGSITVSRSTGGNVAKRGSPGFKVNFEVFNREGTPSEGSFDALARVIGDDWNSRVSGEHNIGDYIALVNFGYMGYIQFRIIPEQSGFGNNFENVDTCAA